MQTSSMKLILAGAALSILVILLAQLPAPPQLERVQPRSCGASNHGWMPARECSCLQRSLSKSRQLLGCHPALRTALTQILPPDLVSSGRVDRCCRSGCVFAVGRPALRNHRPMRTSGKCVS